MMRNAYNMADRNPDRITAKEQLVGQFRDEYIDNLIVKDTRLSKELHPEEFETLKKVLISRAIYENLFK